MNDLERGEGQQARRAGRGHGGMRHIYSKEGGGMEQSGERTAELCIQRLSRTGKRSPPQDAHPFSINTSNDLLKKKEIVLDETMATNSQEYQAQAGIGRI